MLIDANDAYRSIKNGEFIPYFQPLVLLRTGQLAGFEVLARWKHPQHGMIPPDQFIPFAEKDGWIGALSQELTRQAFTSAAALIPAPLTLAINVSPLQLHDLMLPKQIRAISELTGFPMGRVVIEITESALTDNLEHAMTITSELKAMGCSIALDDFGTGYSSLLHLQSLPFDELKVDRSFVSSMMQRRESRKIVAAVVGLGQSLGLTTVAEGVETQEQAEMALWMGCEQGQGWLYGRPLPAADLPNVVAALRQRVLPPPSPWNLSASNLEAQPAQRLAQLQAVYDGAPVGLAFLDSNLRHVSLNRRLADMNGFSVEEHLGRTAAEMVPELFSQLEPDVRRALHGEAVKGVEIKKPAADGNPEQTLLISYEPARDEAGEVVGVSVAIVDITELTFAGNALRESEDQYRHMVGTNPQTLWIMDPQGRKLDVSPQWERTTGLTKELTRDLGWLDALHPDDLQPTMDAIAACVEKGQAIDVEYRMRAPEGGWRWMRSWGEPRFDAAGTIVCWSGSVEDIDQRKQLEEALRKRDSQLQAVLEAVPVGIILATPPGGELDQPNLEIVNEEARRILLAPGLDPALLPRVDSAIVERKLLEVAELPLKRALLLGEKTLSNTLCEAVDGSVVRVNLSGAPIHAPDGRIAGAIVTLEDLEITVAPAAITEPGTTPAPLLRSPDKTSDDQTPAALLFEEAALR